jgi:hypothetical protein
MENEVIEVLLGVSFFIISSTKLTGAVVEAVVVVAILNLLFCIIDSENYCSLP